MAQNKPWAGMHAVGRPEGAATTVKAARALKKIGQAEFWKERQLCEYRRANGLCYNCGDKYDPAHVRTQSAG